MVGLLLMYACNYLCIKNVFKVYKPYILRIYFRVHCFAKSLVWHLGHYYFLTNSSYFILDNDFMNQLKGSLKASTNYFLLLKYAMDLFIAVK